MRISSIAGMLGASGLHCLNQSTAYAAPTMNFGNTLSIRATNGPFTVFTIHLSGTADIHPKANQVVIQYQTRVIAHIPREDNSPFYFKIHLEFLNHANEVVHVLDFNTSEKPNGDRISMNISPDLARKVCTIRSAFYAV